MHFFDIFLVMSYVSFYHGFAEKFDACVIVVDDEKTRLYVVWRKGVVFGVFLLVLASVDYFALTSVFCLGRADDDLLIVENAAHLILTHIDFNSFRFIFMANCHLILAIFKDWSIFELKRWLAVVADRTDSNCELVWHYLDLIVLA